MAHNQIFIIDDDADVRQSVVFLLEAESYPVADFSSGETFLEHLRSSQWAAPCCVLLDIRMPNLSGLEVQLRLNEMGFAWPVVILTGQADVGVAIRAMKSGAFDFLEKPCQSAALLDAVRSALAKATQSVEENVRGAQARALTARLTPRERQVMEGLLAALPNKLIAHEYGLSVRTVEIYRANLMEKLQARGLSEAVRIAIAAGLKPLGERRGEDDASHTRPG